MSYTIEYNRQFIRTKNGYIPCWLCGDNNVTEGWGRNERRSRNWSVFMNWLDVTEDYMLEHIKALYSDYNEHWKKGSTWVTNEGLSRWVKNGCKAAGTIEEILEVNPYLRSVNCHIVFYDKDDKRHIILTSNVSTSRGLEEWLNKVKEFKNSEEFKGHKGFYPVVDFGREDLKHPIRQRTDVILQDDDEYVVKCKNGYLIEIRNNGSSVWCKNVRGASVFKYSEIVKLKERHVGTILGGELAQAKLIKAEKKSQVVYVIKFVDGVYAGQYIGMTARGRIQLVFKPESAKSYTSRKSAEIALERYLISVQKYGNLEIEEF